MKNARNETVTYILFCLYCAVAPLGNLVRFSDQEEAFGLPTLILIAIVGCNAKTAIIEIYSTSYLRSIAALLVWITFASTFAVDTYKALYQSLGLWLYLMFAATAARCWNPFKVRGILKSIIIGAGISAAITLIDWFKVVDIPRVNEVVAATDTGLSAVYQASGPFARRTAMATYYGIAIALSATYYLRNSDRRSLLSHFSLIVAIGCSLSLVLSHNRAGLTGALAAIIVSVLAVPTRTILSLASRLFGLLFVGSIFCTWFFPRYMPEQVEVIQRNLGIAGLVTSEETLESDSLRWEFLKFATKSIGSNPIGHGYSALEGYPDHPSADPHGNVTQIVWGAGVFGILWLMYAVWKIIQEVSIIRKLGSGVDPALPVTVSLLAGLISFAICGLMHTLISTGLAWLCLGLLLASAQRSKTYVSGRRDPGARCAVRLSRVRV